MITSNPYLKKLGFTEDDRVVIFHADDVGMCEAANTAFIRLIENKSLSSGALMTPCAGFEQAASHCNKFPETDMGVHLTFTSEWSNYRWKPLSTKDPQSGLIDNEGCFYATTADAQKHGIAKFIKDEVEAQISRALKAGVDVTHIDMHMGAMLHPNFLPAYIQAGKAHRIPMLAYRMSEEKLKKWNNPQLALKILEILDNLEAEGFPIIDNFYQTDLSKPETRMDEIEQALAKLKPGITHFITHPCVDTPKIRSITDDWAGRIADYEALASDEFKECIHKHSIKVIGYRDLRNIFRSEYCVA